MLKDRIAVGKVPGSKSPGPGEETEPCPMVRSAAGGDDEPAAGWLSA